MLSKQKLIKMEKNTQKLEENVVILGNQQDYTFDIVLTSCMLSPFSDHHKDMKTIIVLGSLIPPSTAEVEQSFRLMKLICAGVRNRLLTENLSHCMRICKFRDLTADEYKQILRLSLKADETKNKKRKVSLPLQLKILHIYVSFFYLLCFYFLISSCLKRKRYLQWPNIMLCMEIKTSFFPPWIPFCSEKFSDTSAPTMQEGGGEVAFGWDWIKLILNSIFIR